MLPVPLRHRITEHTAQAKSDMNQRETGQLSIFLGIVLMVVISLLAFIINVGLFVKAKINLQNAVDAAAWSGASVQARQLSNIGYLNWEMRNNYKEWMFKYYVIGQLAQPKVTTDLAAQGDNMSFTLENFGLSGVSEKCDPYNVPSICFHFGGASATNICRYYAVPGLPRFASQGISGISQHVEGFLDTIVQSKGKDCAQRSVMNFLTTLAWAYGTGATGSTLPNTAEIATNRVGAWPQSILLAARMRNLEMAVNRPPITQGVCTSGDGGCLDINTLMNQSSQIGANTRPIKAFMSGYRNLSRAMQGSFKLTELAPNTPNLPDTSLSQYLIPPTSKAAQKYYLDLIAYPLNLVTFFTSFVMDSGEYGGTPMEGKCTGAKTALPVPGFVFGFAKNPNVMTYYAVKGEAKYDGLFYPFAGDGITLKAYAAAKPFGGKIGPHLFSVGPDGQTIQARNVAPQRSIPYLSGISVGGIPWQNGLPIPVGDDFFALNSDDNVGGTPTQGGAVKFAIPNLLYDFDDTMSSLDTPTIGTTYMELLTRDSNQAPGCRAPTDTAGLYSKTQYQAFYQNLYNNNDVANSIENARQPTRYEALNYMIPTRRNLESTPQIDSVPIVPDIIPADTGFSYSLFAPLIASDGVFTEISTVINAVEDVINNNSSAVQTYLTALQDVSSEILDNSQCTSNGGSVDCTPAAKTIYPPGGSYTAGQALSNDPSCDSLAGKFAVFYSGAMGDDSVCGILPLKEQMRNYITDTLGATQDRLLSYISIFNSKPLANQRASGAAQLMGGYMPGIRQGASPAGEHGHPFSGTDPILSRRNYYSTKFIAMSKVLSGGAYSYKETGLYQEQGKSDKLGIQIQSLGPSYPASTIYNLIPSSELSEFGSAPSH